MLSDLVTKIVLNYGCGNLLGLLKWPAYSLDLLPACRMCFQILELFWLNQRRLSAKFIVVGVGLPVLEESYVVDLIQIPQANG